MNSEIKEEKPYRGSRKHILDWVESPRFLGELTAMAAPASVRIPTPAEFCPKGYASPCEARLDQANPELAAASGVRTELRDWWLKHHRGANTPNWDLVAACEIEGRPGLVLVEAKANWRELKIDGKPRASDATPNSEQNHERIGQAIAEARAGLKKAGFETDIRVDSHYQLANRVAFMWKLATLGIPTVLIYLGFTGDDGIRDAGQPFADAQDWSKAFRAYAQGMVPESMLEKRLDLGNAPAWMLVRSRDVISQSPSVRRG